MTFMESHDGPNFHIRTAAVHPLNLADVASVKSSALKHRLVFICTVGMVSEVVSGD